ncbi:MAG: OadG family protein [Lachnospiraceae bacterium]|nr:OadG family protein [Lachnospiraceae bacterium]
MKTIIKKIAVSFTALLLIVSLSACGQSTDETYGDYTRDDLYNAVYGTWETLDAMTMDELLSYQMYYAQQAETDESFASSLALINEWLSVYPELGDFVSVGDFTVDKSGKTTTATLNVDYTGRDIQLVYVFSTYDMSLNAINIQPVYTMGELMSRAGMNVLMGMGTVFAILIMISLVIYAFNIIPYITKRMDAHKKGKAPVEIPADTEAASRDEYPDEPDDTELVAVITAAIAASTGAATDSFVVRKIKRHS